MDELNVIVRIAREVFEDKNLQPGFRLNQAPTYDSMRHAQFMTEIERECGIAIDDEAIPEDITLGEVARIVSSHR